MKRKYIFLWIAFAVLMIGLVSCEKDNDGVNSDATPYVKYARPTDAAAADSLLTQAAMGSTIALIGEGLEGVCEVWFNDQQASLSPVYVTSTSIIVAVPGKMPGAKYLKEGQYITLKTKKGKESRFDFDVMIPAPRVASIQNEWAPDGWETTIYGDYFFPDENGKLVSVLFPGNLEGEIISFDEQNIRVKVPQGALTGTITVETVFGKGRSQFTFRDKEGMFIDAEDPTNVWNTWGRSTFATIGGTSGQYIKLVGTTGNWAWPADAIVIVYRRPGGTQIVTEGEVTDYALRFECKSVHWSGSHIYFWFEPNEGSAVDIDSPTVAQYLWEPFQLGVDYQTEWTTVTIPLSEFTQNKAGEKPALKMTDLVNFNAFPFGEGPDNVPFELWMDNFRLVKINK